MYKRARVGARTVRGEPARRGQIRVVPGGFQDAAAAEKWSTKAVAQRDTKWLKTSGMARKECARS